MCILKLGPFFSSCDSHKKVTSLTVKAARFIAQLQQLLVRFVRRSEDKNPRVETVGPTRVWCCRQLLPLKELIYV